MVDISVIVITKNEERNIAGCLNSLCALDYDNGEYEIIVCDSSSDKTPEIVRQFSKVRLFAVEKKGFGAARNLGVAKARYDFIAFTDADCVVPRNWLTRLSSEITGFAGVGGSAFPPEGSGYFGKCIACLGYPAGGALGADAAAGIISTCNAMFRKKALLSVGGFDEGLRWGGEDTALSKKLVAAGHKLKIDSNIFVWHKTRKLSEFFSWCFRRGFAKHGLGSSALQLLMPLSVFAYPFTKKFITLVKRRKKIGITAFSILITVPLLFFLRQLMISSGWLAGRIKNGNAEIIAGRL